MHYLEMASQYLANPWQTILKEPLFPFRFFKMVDAMFAYGEGVMADRRARPREDLLTAIARSKLGGEELPQEHLDGAWLLIIFAGNDTSRNSLTGTIQLLHEFSDQRQMVLDDPKLIPRMAEEALRLVSPVKHMRRTALEETELNGQRIAKDEKVVMWYGAANRDPTIFPDPNRFDMMRDNYDKHLAFGHGVHKCLGSRKCSCGCRLKRSSNASPKLHPLALWFMRPMRSSMRCRALRSIFMVWAVGARHWWPRKKPADGMVWRVWTSTAAAFQAV
jgi:cytochrome P450